MNTTHHAPRTTHHAPRTTHHAPRTTHFALKLLSLFVLSVVFSSCEKDPEETTSPPGTNIYKIVYEEEIRANEKLVATLNEFLNQNNTVARKDIHNDQYGYTIYTDKAIYIETPEGYHSYTFYISFDNADDDYLNNIMLSLNSTGGYDVFGVEYQFTPQEFENISQSELANSDILLTPLSLDGNEILDDVAAKGMPYTGVLCIAILTVTTSEDCEEGQVTGDVDFYECTEYDIEFIDCSAMESTSTAGTGSFIDIGAWGDTMPHGSGGTSANGSHTGPILPPYYDTIKQLYLQLLPDLPAGEVQTIKDWLFANPQIALSIDNLLNNYISNSPVPIPYQDRLDFVLEGLAFLIANNYSYAASDFFQQAIFAFWAGGKVDYDEIIILDEDFVNNPCLNGVYNDLDVSDIASDFLSNFQGQYPVAHLKLSASSFGSSSTANAVTYSPQNFVIEIEFNLDNLSRPRTSVARTFMHEIIHAEMFRKLLSLAQQGSIPWSEAFIISIKDNFPGLTDYYLRWYYNVPPGQPVGEPQHELMAQHYRETISDFLMQFDPNLTQVQADALAWVGLAGTVAWNNLTAQEQNNIVQVVNSFNANNPDC